MKKKFEYSERKGLPGGPNETFSYTTRVFSTEGYKRYSPDVNNPFNIIPSGNITMRDVDFPVEGTDNLGNSIMMKPGYDYKFPGNMVFERPIKEEKAVKPYGSINTFGNMAVTTAGLKSKNLDIEAKYAKLLEQLGESTGFFNLGINAKANKNNYQFNINPNISLSGEKPRIGINAGIKKTFRKGGGLLTKSMKCNNCGWSWRAVDGGKDVTTCHKCGGTVLPKAQEGRENMPTYLPDKGGYRVPVDLESGNIKGGILPEVTVSGEATPLVTYKKAYETNNPFDAQQYATDLFNNPKSREEYFDRFNKDKFFQKYGQRGYNEFQDNAWKFAAEQRMSQLPQGNRSREEYLNDLTAKEEEVFKKYNPALQTTYGTDFLRAINAKDRESYEQLKDKLYNGPEKDLYTEREKQNMLQNYKYIGGVHGGDALAPFTWMSKPIQSIYRDDYSGYDALVGRKNDASLKEDLITDPTLLYGLGKSALNLGVKGLTKLGTAGLNNYSKSFKQLPGSGNALNLEELRRVYHNSERFLQPQETNFLHKHGYGKQSQYSNDNWTNNFTSEQVGEWWRIRGANQNQLPPPPSEIQFMPDGTTRTVYDPNWRQTWGTGNWNPNTSTSFKPKPVNKSGLTKEEVIEKASAKDKDVVSKMSETEFENTVLKPNGEIAPYYQGSLEPQFSGSQNVAPLSPKEYADEFNSRLDLLNDIIAQRNKSGVEYRVKGLDESGMLKFYTPAGQKGKNPLIKGGLEDVIIPEGESNWGVRLNPGQWRGNVEDIASTEYFRSIPGLEMSNTTSGVFADNVARKGTGAYESINEYLKRLDLGRVKPGFNVQTDFSRGAWENFIKSGRGVGFYANPRTVYGTMKTIIPPAFITGAGVVGSQYFSNPQEQVEYRNGGSLPKAQEGREKSKGETRRTAPIYITPEMTVQAFPNATPAQRAALSTGPGNPIYRNTKSQLINNKQAGNSLDKYHNMKGALPGFEFAAEMSGIPGAVRTGVKLKKEGPLPLLKDIGTTAESIMMGSTPFSNTIPSPKEDWSGLHSTLDVMDAIPYAGAAVKGIKTGLKAGTNALVKQASKPFALNLDDGVKEAFKPLKANPSSSSVSKLGIKQEIPKPIKKQELDKFVKQKREKLFPDDLENAPKQTAQSTDSYGMPRTEETNYPKINPTKEYTDFKSKIKGTPDDDYLFRLNTADYMSSNKGLLIDPLPINVRANYGVRIGELAKTGDVKLTRPSVHFSKNHIIHAHNSGDWSAIPTIIMSTEDDILRANSGFRKNKWSADSDIWFDTMGKQDALYYPKETTHIITGEPKMALQAKKLGYNVLYSDELSSLNRQIKKLQKEIGGKDPVINPEIRPLNDKLSKLESQMNTYKQSIVNDLANTSTKKNIKGLNTQSSPAHSVLSNYDRKYLGLPDATLDLKYGIVDETPAFKNLNTKANEILNQYKTLKETSTEEAARAFFNNADGDRIVSLANAPGRLGLKKDSPEYLRAISEFGEGINAPTKKIFKPAANFESVQRLKEAYDIPEWHAKYLQNQPGPTKLSNTANKYRLGFYQDGGSLPKAQEGMEELGKEVNNLKDFVITNEELNFLNSNKKEYCPKGNCLESTKKAFNLTASKIKGVPDMYNVFENDLKVTSAKGKPTEEMIESNPWFAGDVNVSSSDSWDVQGNILNSEGRIVYNRNNTESIYYPGKAAIGSIYSFGPKDKKDSEFENRNKGYNTKFGLQPSHHSVSVVGFNKESNENILYDSYLRKYLTESELIKELDKELGYELETIGTPKSYVNLTRENLEGSDNLYNPNIMFPYKVDVDNLKELTRDPAVRYTYIEDGKEKYRQPGFNSDAMKGFVTSLEDNKEVMINTLGISNEKYDRLADLAIAIAMAETEGGAELSLDWLGETQGLTQLNYANIKDDEVLQKTIDKINDQVSVTNKINSISDLRTPSKSAIATIAYLSKFENKAKNLLEEGEMPSERTFYDNMGFKDNFRYSTAKINKDGFYVDAIGKRIPFDEIEGWKEKDINKVTRYLNKLTSANDYNAILDNNGKIAITMKTKGNKMDMPYGKIMAYFWQAPNTLATGDAQGKSVYASRVSHYYDKIQDLKKNSENSDLKYQTGGQLPKAQFGQNISKLYNKTKDAISEDLDYVERIANTLPQYLNPKTYSYTKEEGLDSIPNYNKYNSFGEAFKQAREDLGRGQTFLYNGKRYTTTKENEFPSNESERVFNTMTKTLSPEQKNKAKEYYFKQGAPYLSLEADDTKFNILPNAQVSFSDLSNRAHVNPVGPYNKVYLETMDYDFTPDEISEYEKSTGKTFYDHDPSLLVEELAHIEQARDKGTGPFFKHFFFDAAKGALQNKSPYDTKGAIEYDAHEVIGPKRLKEIMGYQKGGEYTVQAGNTFDGIANLNQVPKDLLRKANPGIDYNNIKVGQVINIPGAPKTKEERMEFSSGRKKEDLTQNILSANKLENYLAESRGNTPEFWKATADTIAYHESGPWQRMDPKAIQRSKNKDTNKIFEGPGEGLFQIETDRAGGSNSFLKFKNRYANIAEALDMDADPEIMNAKRPIDLPAEKQYTLFYSNLIGSPNVKLKDYVDGKLSLEDLWLKGHKIKEAKGDRKHFQESVQNARDKGIPFIQIGEETSDLEIYKNYINGLYDGTEMEAAAQRLYDKLNRVYYGKAKGLGMSVPNYIMTNIINRSN